MSTQELSLRLKTKFARMMATPIPKDVFDYVKKVFRACNRRLGMKLTSVPNASEPSLDLTMIEQLSQFSAPTTLPSDWTVRIDTHYLGGLRHFGQWEVADIGVLVFLSRAGQMVRNKVALLQSKRLYPDSGEIDEEEAVDYSIGFARLHPAGPSITSMAIRHVYYFSEQSKYRALHVRDHQWCAIEQYQQHRQIPIYYLLYNPWRIPFTQTFPLTHRSFLQKNPTAGCRVIPSSLLMKFLSKKPDGYSPEFQEICGLVQGHVRHRCGWKIEYFVSHLLLGCAQGRIFRDTTEPDLEQLFTRRSGPIAAAIGINIEMPEYADWEPR